MFFKKGGKKALYILGVVHCACSDCPPVVLIFNGKWLRFLSKPLELRDRKRREWEKKGVKDFTSRFFNQQTANGETDTAIEC